ncbi:Peptidase aspartic [Beauveria brongniartii RCEF 3172]|uniref:Peptidase aspartic n=1 Tax=Beauveria brongniartii RCEF 3172 TaxID=1081107 RepID=A0A166Z6H3_9HYPO|nr:Peptidase aspartic [Beauveria brongniartii RCEF 3172]
MLFSAFVIVSAATSVLASPVQHGTTTTLPLKRVGQIASASQLVKQGKARISYNVNAGKKAIAGSAPAENIAVSYVANVTVGSGSYQLILDTGSSITWVGASKPYQPGPSSKDTGKSATLGYGSGFAFAEEYIDKVTIGSVSVNAQAIGVASFAYGFGAGNDGIFGLGPVALTTYTFPGGAPTFLDNLYKDKTISQEVIGVYFHPETGSDNNDVNGEITFGAVDSTKFSGQVAYVPTLTSGPSAPFWGVSASFQYGSTNLGSTNAGIVDTGTTLIYINTAAFNAFLKASGGTLDQNGLVSYTQKPTSNFSITFGSTKYDLTPAQYLIPKEQYANLKITDSSKFYAWINNGGNGTDQDGNPTTDTIVGQKFLEYYYSVYDTTNSRVGFAKAS